MRPYNVLQDIWEDMAEEEQEEIIRAMGIAEGSMGLSNSGVCVGAAMAEDCYDTLRFDAKEYIECCLHY